MSGQRRGPEPLPGERLPEPLRRGAEELRRAAPRGGFEQRLNAAIVADGRKRHVGAHSWWVLLPTAAIILVSMHVGSVEPSGGLEAAPVSRFEERHVSTSETGDAWVDLDLWTHHHHGERTTVSVTTPSNVSLHVGEAATARVPDSCHGRGCVHRFTDEGPPLRLRVPGPGRYEVTVRHESSQRTVHEQFVVHAQ